MVPRTLYTILTASTKSSYHLRRSGKIRSHLHAYILLEVNLSEKGANQITSRVNFFSSDVVRNDCNLLQFRLSRVIYCNLERCSKELL